ncbi:hypothetical protein AC578_4496 [Pseudocercospora eumusae]|uniref:Checkpoint protein RAD24-like helical bundle domain-containing protein n=1 Tax=Pseudocercospora eumusae TaxID=321146 RepID=A0A139GWD7_9PEZI|nr:hypothetical protein AC578_4496 [Pseudocercospora eumusae]
MGPRAVRRKAVVVSSDVEDGDDDDVEADDGVGTSVKSQKPSSGKLKSVRFGSPPASAATKHRKETPQPSPQKSKSRTKARGNAKGSPKQSGKPIYSFFNAATQRQQASQSSAAAIPHHEVEAIEDDSDDAGLRRESSTTTRSQDSSKALAVRKRKLGHTQSLEDEASLPPAASQKFRKTSNDDKKANFVNAKDDRRPWTERFAPADISELAVHKRKVADVRGWLETTFRGKRHKILVLKGPAGTGKTTTVRLLAQELGIELLEWRDPGAVESDGTTSAAARFEEFVVRAGKVSGLKLTTRSDMNTKDLSPPANDENDCKKRPQAILVEEFPNTFSRTSSALQSFRSTLAQYVSTTVSNDHMPTPMIMVISETLLSTNTATADSFTAHRLLGPELNTNPYINIIEFNPIAHTYMVKALETIVVKEARKSGRRRTPGPQIIERLAESGDIRSAVSSLEFLCVRGDDGQWSSKVTFTKPKTSKLSKNLPPLTNAEEEAMRLISNRESSLGIFHAVGKVVYNKRTDPADRNGLTQPPAWLPQHRRSKMPETNPDSLIDELGTDTSTFVASLHENYLLSCGTASSEETLDSVSGCIDNMSDADLMSLDRISFGTRAFSGSAADNLRQDELAFQVAVRGVLFSLPYPVHRAEPANGRRGDAFKMFYPASLRLWRKREELEEQLDAVTRKLADKGAAGAAKSRATKSQSANGVEGWRNNSSLSSANNAGVTQDVDIQPQLSKEAKQEMLMDRLPYLAQILSGPKASPLSRALRERVTEITRLDGLSLPEDNDDADMEESEAAENVEQWSTDRPDLESSRTTTSPWRKRPPEKPPIIFEGVKLPSMESEVDKLVLEDDDIED